MIVFCDPKNVRYASSKWNEVKDKSSFVRIHHAPLLPTRYEWTSRPQVCLRLLLIVLNAKSEVFGKKIVQFYITFLSISPFLRPWIYNIEMKNDPIIRNSAKNVKSVLDWDVGWDNRHHSLTANASFKVALGNAAVPFQFYYVYVVFSNVSG